MNTAQLERISIKLKKRIESKSTNCDIAYAVNITLMILANAIDEVLKEDYKEFERTLKRNE